MPALEEVGLYFRDGVARFRAARATAVAQKAEARMRELGIDQDGVKVHPRLGIAIIDKASWTDDDELQDLWAGLLVSSATPDGRDDSNLIFTDLLGRLTTSQARVLAWMCQKTDKVRTRSGLILAGNSNIIPIAGALKVMELDDIQRLDRELDHLRTLGLSSGGLEAGESADEKDPLPPVNLTPTPLALQLYARCQGARDPLAFYGLQDAAPVRVMTFRGVGGVQQYIVKDETK
jgi:hypothetical protein